ncbi:MAG: nuclear transport factor 2 family protein [Candidatus Methanofastidiosia archaeon]|jgi:ketosteroid isomerase-like protein
MTTQSPIDTALKFVECINAGDADKLMTLVTKDFTFIDKVGEVTTGKERWDYFEMYPEYKIHVKHVLKSGNSVAIIGKTTGSHVPPELEEKETIMWIAEIDKGYVAEWRIYSDIEEIRKAQEKT